MTQALKIGKWYRIRIVTTGRHDFKVFLNNLTIIDSLSDSNDVSGPVSFDISDISVGAGFNKERVFDGEIRDFKIEYEMSERRIGLTCLFFVLRSLLLTLPALFLALLSLVLIRNHSASILKYFRGENIAFLHTIAFSVAFIKIVEHAYFEISGMILPANDTPVYQWAQHLYFPDKPKEVLFYALMITAFFIYYASAYLLIFRSRLRGYCLLPLIAGFPLFICYLFVLKAINLFFIGVPAAGTPTADLLITPLLWLTFWLLPFLPFFRRSVEKGLAA